MEEFTSFIWAFSEFFIKLIINEVLIQIKNVVKIVSNAKSLQCRNQLFILENFKYESSM